MKNRLPKGRYIVLIWLLPIFVTPGFDSFYSFFIGGDYVSHWWDILYYYYYFGLVTLLLTALIYFNDLNWQSMLSNFNQSILPPAIKLTIFILLFSIAATYILFLPLSYLFPEFVTWWLIDLPPLVYKIENGYPIIINLLNLVTLIILAPLIEEFTFRGLLLHRWNEKWGLYKAMILSSALFAIMHPDVLGAFAFGIAMCIIYLRTQTLWVPIICHALNNLIVWLIEVCVRVFSGEDYTEYTLNQFQKEWYIGLICSVIVLIWFNSYIKRPQSKNVWKLPSISKYV